MTSPVSEIFPLTRQPTTKLQSNFDPVEQLVMFKSMASILSPATASHEKDQSPYFAAESDDRDCSDVSVNADALPEDHPTHFLAEAQTHYSNGRQPPFVLNKRSEVMKTVVIPTKYGLRPKDDKAVKAKIIAKVCAIRLFSFHSVSYSLESSHDSTSTHEESMLSHEPHLALG